MLIAGIDFETSGVDPEKCDPIEYAVRVVNENNEFRESQADYIWHESYAPLTDFIKELTGITDDKLRKGGISPLEALEDIHNIIRDVDYIVAYNKKFDEKVYHSLCARNKVEPLKTRWICLMDEVPYSNIFKCRKLSHLAIDHGLAVDPKLLHGAFEDVALMFNVIKVGGYKWEDIIKYATQKFVVLKADIKAPWLDGGKQKEIAKSEGFRWNGELKQWTKRVPEVEFLANPKMLNDLAFKVTLV